MCGSVTLTAGKTVIAALACIACAGVSFADSLDLAGVDKTVSDIAEVSGYDELTNSSGTLATLTFSLADGVDTAYAGVISGNIKLVMAGSKSKLTLSGANTYTGGTSVQGGVIVIANQTACGDSTKSVVLESFTPTATSLDGPWCALQFDVSDFANPITLAEGSTVPSWVGNTYVNYNLCVTNASKTSIDSPISGGYFSLLGTKVFAKSDAPLAGTIEFNGPITCTGMKLYAGVINFKGAVTNSVTDISAGVYHPMLPQAHFYSAENAFNGTSLASYRIYLYPEGDDVLSGLDTISFTRYNQYSIMYLQGHSETIGGLVCASSTDATDSDRYQVVNGGSGDQSVLTMTGGVDMVSNIRLIGNMDLVWDPAGDYTFTASSNRTSTMVGKLEIKGGTFELDGGHTMLGVTNITIASGATLKISTANALSSSVAIQAKAGATIELAEDISVTTFKLGNKYLAVKDYEAGTYSSGALTITGDGKLYVLSKPGDVPTYTWTGSGSDVNITTDANWEDSVAPDFDSETPYVIFAGGTSATLDRDVAFTGITFEGPTSFELAATGSCVLMLGAGGISNAPAAFASTVAISAPVMPIVDQVWQMDTNVTFTLSGVLKQYGTATPTITVRPGSVADPVVTINGATTSEAASDFAGNIVFARFAADDSVYWTQHIRASGYEPFGSTGTLTIEGNAQNNPATKGRHPALYLDNATISKDVSVVNARYAIDIAAVPNTTNTLNGALTFSDFAPRFWAASNSVVTVKGDLNNLISEGVGVNTRFRILGPIDDSPYDGSGRIVFDGKIDSKYAVLEGRIMRIEAAVTVVLNAQSNRFEKIYSGSKNANVICGTKDAIFDGNMIWHPYGHATGSYPCSLDLAGYDQNMGCLTAGNKSAKIKSSDASATLSVNQTNEVSFLGTIATNVTLKMVGTGVLTFSNASAFEAGSTLAVSNGTVVLENATALNGDVDLEFLGGTISVPSGTIAEVGFASYVDEEGNLKDLCTGYYDSSATLVGSYFASGSGSIHVTKGRPGGMVLIFR